MLCSPLPSRAPRTAACTRPGLTNAHVLPHANAQADRTHASIEAFLNWFVSGLPADAGATLLLTMGSKDDKRSIARCVLAHARVWWRGYFHINLAGVHIWALHVGGRLRKNAGMGAADVLAMGSMDGKYSSSMWGQTVRNRGLQCCSGKGCRRVGGRQVSPAIAFC